MSANTSTANNATHRTLMRTPLSGSLTVKATADFQSIDSFMILLQPQPAQAVTPFVKHTTLSGKGPNGYTRLRP